MSSHDGTQTSRTGRGVAAELVAMALSLIAAAVIPLAFSLSSEPRNGVLHPPSLVAAAFLCLAAAFLFRAILSAWRSETPSVCAGTGTLAMQQKAFWVLSVAAILVGAVVPISVV